MLFIYDNTQPGDEYRDDVCVNSQEIICTIEESKYNPVTNTGIVYLGQPWVDLTNVYVKGA